MKIAERTNADANAKPNQVPIGLYSWIHGANRLSHIQAEAVVPITP